MPILSDPTIAEAHKDRSTLSMTDQDKNVATKVALLLLDARKKPTDKEIYAAAVYATTAVVNMGGILESRAANRATEEDREEISRTIKKNFTL